LRKWSRSCTATIGVGCAELEMGVPLQLPLPEKLFCATISKIQYLVFSGLEHEIWC